ncbi:hypothetical protein O6H91_02G100900 [Diphasiastrum complanatum]|uniref:Uncharacterized protein n=1 Tax=Diphasiastrum complanatum TaxID=34168 RepID=A0ACC2EIT6_DIPCM|nr:hypothetical protein O6H91_02G100900 [Diphasiastrum complanatum]
MVSTFADFGFINLQLIAISSATVHFRMYPKPLDKQTRVNPSRWQEELRPAPNQQNVEHDIRPSALSSTPSRPYRPSLRPSLETIEEQESQIHLISIRFCPRSTICFVFVDGTAYCMLRA